jgi:hypothetical protein
MLQGILRLKLPLDGEAGASRDNFAAEICRQIPAGRFMYF